MRPDIVCLDTNILIWGIKENASRGQEDMVARATELIQALDRNGSEIIVPSLVLAELLMPIKEDNHASFLAEITKRFIIAPFDTAASLHCASLWKKWSSQNRSKQTQNIGSSRTKMKTDFMIVATAITRKSGCIYSADSDIAKFAAGHIEARNLSNFSYQGRIPV